MRPVCSAALAAFVTFVALPACEPGTGGSGDPPMPPIACPLPEPIGCDAQQCNEVGSCSLFTCDTTTGTWVQTFCDAGPAKVDGRWSFTRYLPADPCPEITRAELVQLVATPAVGGGEAISSLDGTRLSLGKVHPGFGSTQVIFGFDERWSAGDVALPVRVSYDLHFSSSGDIDGEATASVPLGERTCEYSFSVSGERQ